MYVDNCFSTTIPFIVRKPETRNQTGRPSSAPWTVRSFIFWETQNNSRLKYSRARRLVMGESFANKDITLNTFWSSRINKSIISIDALQSTYSVEGSGSAFGVEVFLDGAESFVIEYLSDEAHQDQVRITGSYEGPPCRRIAVAKKD